MVVLELVLLVIFVIFVVQLRCFSLVMVEVATVLCFCVLLWNGSHTGCGTIGFRNKMKDITSRDLA